MIFERKQMLWTHEGSSKKWKRKIMLLYFNLKINERSKLFSFQVILGCVKSPVKTKQHLL